MITCMVDDCSALYTKSIYSRATRDSANVAGKLHTLSTPNAAYEKIADELNL